MNVPGFCKGPKPSVHQTQERPEVGIAWTALNVPVICHVTPCRMLDKDSHCNEPHRGYWRARQPFLVDTKRNTAVQPPSPLWEACILVTNGRTCLLLIRRSLSEGLLCIILRASSMVMESRQQTVVTKAFRAAALGTEPSK